jgi:hypothetical protein
MQLEFNLNIEVVKKKTKNQKEEELRYLYSERLFHGNLERMSQTWNIRQEDEGCSLTD